MEVIPGILEKEWKPIERKIKIVQPFAKTIHIDIVDGKFAPNTSFLDPKPFAKYSSDIFFELHMMVEEPVQYLKPFADAGFKRFLGHVEQMSDIPEFVAQGQLLGEVGLAIDGKTSLDSLEIPYEDLDCLLFMTINAGFSGQSFMPEHLEKVLRVAQDSSRGFIPMDKFSLQSQGKPFPIEVDGGINDKTILLAKEKGATRCITTSFLFNNGNPEEQYHKLQQLLMVG